MVCRLVELKDTLMINSCVPYTMAEDQCLICSHVIGSASNQTYLQIRKLVFQNTDQCIKDEYIATFVSCST